MEPEAVSDTPRTDALHQSLVKLSEGPFWIAGKDYIDMKTHAEKLKRENAALRERIAELEAALRSNAESAMQAHGASFEDLHICGNCNGTGYTA